MALVRCAKCGATVSTDDRSCGNCGYCPTFKCVFCIHASCGCDDVWDSCDFTGEICGDYQMACPAGVYDDSEDCD